MNYDDQLVMTSHELRKWMEQFGYDASSLAELLGVTKTCVSYWLMDKRKMPQTTIKLLNYFSRYPMTVFNF